MCVQVSAETRGGQGRTGLNQSKGMRGGGERGPRRHPSAPCTTYAVVGSRPVMRHSGPLAGPMSPTVLHVEKREDTAICSRQSVTSRGTFTRTMSSLSNAERREGLGSGRSAGGGGHNASHLQVQRERVRAQAHQSVTARADTCVRESEEQQARVREGIEGTRVPGHANEAITHARARDRGRAHSPSWRSEECDSV